MNFASSVSWSLVELVADHLWQSTWVLAVVTVLAVMLRNNRAQVRYWLWLVASAKFAVPFAVLMAIGSGISWPEGRAVVSQFVAPAGVVVEPFGQVVVPLVDQAGTRSSNYTSLWPVIAAIWIVGSLGLAARWLIRWRGIAAIAAAGSPATAGREVEILRALERRAGHRRELPVVLTDSALEPGVFGVLRPRLLWPRDVSARLDDGQIEAILAHELAHVRRYDNLAALGHMAVQAVFWFHPLVWWVGARLIQERERACDEDVLRLGSDPTTYAEGILKTCRFHIESPLACVSGVTGADLKRRIEQIMSSERGHFLTIRRKLLLTSIALVALVGPVLAGSLQSSGRAATQARRLPDHVVGTDPVGDDRLGPMLHGYSLMATLRNVLRGSFQPAFTDQDASVVPPPAEFEVASVKENRSGDNRITFGLQGERFTGVNVTLRELIRFAYGVQMSQIEGGPDWMTSARFDVIGKMPSGAIGPTIGPGQMSAVNMMMRDLLEKRFKLVVERPLKDSPIYELMLARSDGKLGPSLQKSTVDCAAMTAARRGGGPPPPLPEAGDRMSCGMFMAPNRVQAGSTPMTQLAQLLSQRVGRIVTDKTGLTGNYDFTLEFTPDPGLGGGPLDGPPGAPPLPPSDPNAPSIFTALQEQLGLKLESRRAPIEMLSIKSVERPTPD